jgi:L-alanine-DL-glutamate epimerase-like enolase superfamily enzyme
LGHKAIREALKPYGVQVATGEACQNRVVWKQLFQAGAIDVAQVIPDFIHFIVPSCWNLCFGCMTQIDSCRVGGVNEVLAIILMAAKFKVPVCPHAGGVGLCGYVQHLVLFYCSLFSLVGNRWLSSDIDHFI